MFITTAFTPHLVERQLNHCFQAFSSSEQAPEKLFIVDVALHSKGLQSNTCAPAK